MILQSPVIIAAEICFSIYLTRRIFWYFAEKALNKERKEKGLDYLMLNKGMSLGIELEEKCLDPKHNILCSNIISCNEGKLNYILELIRNAKNSLDVCIYIISADMFGKSILEAKKRGAKVRVITDADMGYKSNSCIKNFISNEIPVRTKQSSFIMHHKFLVIDNEILIMGSMNFTMSAIYCNWESLILTSAPKIVKDYSRTFTKLWQFMES